MKGKKMNDRKKYIDDNRALIDDKEPTNGHELRFEALLEEQGSKQPEEAKKAPARRIKLISLISVAASIAILIGVAVRFYAPGSIDVPPQNKNIENTSLMDEFQATNDYYNQQMEERIADIMCKLAYTDSENQAQLTEDLQNIIEDNNTFIDEMTKNENKEIALKYLVKHYKTNIQILEDIDNKLGKHTKC